MDYLTVIFSASALIIAGFNAAIWCVVKFNDMIHIQKSQDEMKATLIRIEDKVDKSIERIAMQEGICKARTKC